MRTLVDLTKRFSRDESGATSIEFVLAFPVFFGFFLMTYEGGMIAAQHVMLERGVDLAVRDLRIGVMENPTRAELRTRICEAARIIPDCIRQLDIELVERDPWNWANLSNTIECVNRGDLDEEETEVDASANNILMVMRVCARIDPLIPTTGLGKVIVQQNDGDAAGGSHALFATAAFVVEPFRAETE